MQTTNLNEKNFDVIEWRSLAGEDYDILSIDSRRISQCMDYYQKSKIGGIHISKAHGYRLNDLKFLKDYPFIKRIVVNYAPGIFVSDLAAIPTLRSITIGNNQEPIDFSTFPNLEELIIDWHPKVAFPQKNTSLKLLSLSNYKPKSKDFTELPNFINLTRLQIVRSPLNTLRGLGRFKKLKILELCYLPKLDRIEDLDAYSVEELAFDVCKKISDHEHLVKLPKLKKLMLCNCGSISSLKFLDRMPTLRWFSFVDTNILDGDMTPCFRLEFAGTLSKKHYSHTSEEIKAIIAERQKSKRGRT